MKTQLLAGLFLASSGVLAQTSNDAERLRISTERATLEEGFSREDAACYKKFFVNNCLNEVKNKRRDALADLRRQEISINDQERKAKAAEQIQKTEDKASLAKQQEDADKRAQAMRDFDARTARDQQKNADRLKLESNEKPKLEAAAARLKGAQDKASNRTARQAAAVEEFKKYNDRQEKAKDRQARMTRDKASQTRQLSSPLPAPE